MINMLKSNFYKLRYSTGFRVLFIVSIILAIIEFFNLAYGNGDASETGMIGSLAFYAHLVDLRTVIFIFSGVLSGIFIGEDFATRTFQGEIAAGNSRSKVLLSKTIVFIIGVLILIIIQLFIVLVGTSLVNGFGDFSFSVITNIIRAVLMFIFQLSACSMIFILTSVLLKNKASIISVNFILLLLVDGILQMLSNLNKSILNFYLNSPLALSLSSSMPEISQNDLRVSIIIGSFTIVVIYLISNKYFSRCELK